MYSIRHHVRLTHNTAANSTPSWRKQTPSQRYRT